MLLRYGGDQLNLVPQLGPKCVAREFVYNHFENLVPPPFFLFMIDRSISE